MDINTEILKKLRNDAKISQEKAGEIIKRDAKTVSRYETGKAKLDMWTFKIYLEGLGVSTEDYWMLFLNTGEYHHYRIYKRLKRLNRDRQNDEIRKILEENEEVAKTAHPFFKRYLDYLRINVDKEMPCDAALDKLRKIMKASLKDFNEEKIAEYRLTADEISILTSIASLVFRMGEHDKAIGIVESMIKSRGTSEATEEDREKVFPVLYSNLSTMLGKAGRHKEALKVADEGLDLCKEYGNLKWIPNLLYNKASSLLLLGEESIIFKPYLVRAYHCACAFGKKTLAETIKNDAKADFGIDLD